MTASAVRVKSQRGTRLKGLVSSNPLTVLLRRNFEPHFIEPVKMCCVISELSSKKRSSDATQTIAWDPSHQTGSEEPCETGTPFEVTTVETKSRSSRVDDFDAAQKLHALHLAVLVRLKMEHIQL